MKVKRKYTLCIYIMIKNKNDELNKSLFTKLKNGVSTFKRRTQSISGHRSLYQIEVHRLCNSPTDGPPG